MAATPKAPGNHAVIGAVIRNYLLENPDLVREALERDPRLPVGGNPLKINEGCWFSFGALFRHYSVSLPFVIV